MRAGFAWDARVGGIRSPARSAAGFPRSGREPGRTLQHVVVDLAPNHDARLAAVSRLLQLSGFTALGSSRPLARCGPDRGQKRESLGARIAWTRVPSGSRAAHGRVGSRVLRASAAFAI
jgi:hypothetical protein